MLSKQRNGILRAVGALAALSSGFTLWAASCGDDSKPANPDAGSGLTCGKGTHAQDGMCVPDAPPAPSVVNQSGMLQPPPAGKMGTEWDTPYSLKTGVSLMTRYTDPDPKNAWDPAKHPLVFITTVGPGYGGILGGVKWPGVAIIDAETHEVVNYTAYDLTGEGWKPEEVFEPHGLAVSPDGKWIYLPTGKTGGQTTDGRFLIINARTMKLDKQLAMRPRGRPHHTKSFQDADGKDRVLIYGWEQPPAVLDPNDDNKVVGGVDFNDTGMEGYLYFVTPDGKEMWGSGRWRFTGVASEAHANIIMIIDTATWKLKSYIPFPGEGVPVWVEFSPDNKYAYVSGGHSSTVLKYDRVAKKRLGIARSGVEGPYGIRLNWSGTELYTVGKGEGSTNRGKDLGLVDPKLIDVSDRPINTFITDCVRGDHATLNPVSAKNELWLSCNSSFEVAIFDMTAKKVSARIPMPSGGSTHSGAFVKYEPDFSGRVLSDQNGLHGTALAESLAMQK